MKRLTAKVPGSIEQGKKLGVVSEAQAAPNDSLRVNAALAERLQAANYQVDAGLVVLDQSSAARGLAIDRLARYENVHLDLLERQTNVTRQLEVLRAKGQTKTVQFRELLGEKLMNSHLLNLLKIYGLEMDPDDG